MIAFIFTRENFVETINNGNAFYKNVVADYQAGEIIDLSDIYDYVENTLGGNVLTFRNHVAAGAVDGILQVSYLDSNDYYTVDLAQLTGYTGAINGNPEPALTAFDSLYYYSGTTHSIMDTDGMALLSPLDGTTLIDPMVWADSGATTYTVTASYGGSGSFIGSGPEYSFTPDVGFEDSDGIAAFTYTASNGSGDTSSESVVLIRHQQAGAVFAFGDSVGGEGNDVIVGSNIRDTLQGNGGDDFLVAHEGDDTLFGGEGNDILSGGAGRDSLYGNQGDDRLFGGLDNDTFYYELTDDYGEDFVDGGDGVSPGTTLNEFDTLQMRILGTNNLEYFQLTKDVDGNALLKDSLSPTPDWATARTLTIDGIEFLRLLDFGTGDQGMDVEVSGDFTGTQIQAVKNNAGGLQVDASGMTAGTFSAVGGDGDDYVLAGGGDDVFFKNNSGEDEFYAGIGNDQVIYYTSTQSGSLVAYGEGGEDFLSVQGSNLLDTISVTSDGSTQITMTVNGVTSTYFDFETFRVWDYPSSSENGLHVTLSGDFSQSLLGIDYSRIVGSGGEVYLDASGVTSQTGFTTGFSSSAVISDTLIGGAGNDRLDGGFGNDFLTGNDGNDLFVFGRQFDSSNFGDDTVTDFDDGVDMIDLSENTAINTYDQLTINQDGTDAVINDMNGNSITLIGVDKSLLSSDDFLF